METHPPSAGPSPSLAWSRPVLPQPGDSAVLRKNANDRSAGDSNLQASQLRRRLLKMIVAHEKSRHAAK